MFLLLLACFSSEPAPPAPAPPAVVQAPAAPDADAPPAPEQAELSLEQAITRSCQQVQDCGCPDGQTQAQCEQGALGTNMPASVYDCIAQQSCETLCRVEPTGSTNRGVKECVQPWVLGQLDGAPGTGLGNKHVRTVHTVDGEEPRPKPRITRIERIPAPDAQPEAQPDQN